MQHGDAIGDDERIIGSLGFARVDISPQLPHGFLDFVTGEHCIRQLQRLVLELTKADVADAASRTPENGLIQYIDSDGISFIDAAQRRGANNGQIDKLLLEDPLDDGGSAWWTLEPGPTQCWWSRADLREAVAGELPLSQV